MTTLEVMKISKGCLSQVSVDQPILKLSCLWKASTCPLPHIDWRVQDLKMSWCLRNCPNFLKWVLLMNSEYYRHFTQYNTETIWRMRALRYLKNHRSGSHQQHGKVSLFLPPPISNWTSINKSTSAQDTPEIHPSLPLKEGGEKFTRSYYRAKGIAKAALVARMVTSLAK